MCTHVHKYVFHSACVKVRGQLAKVSSFYCVDSGIQIFRLPTTKHLYLLSHLVNLNIFLIQGIKLKIKKCCSVDISPWVQV